jgi:hypothetical protein
MNPPTATPQSAPLEGELLERRLEELLHQDRFQPPTSFVAAARVNDASLHAQAELDSEAFWAEEARTLPKTRSGKIMRRLLRDIAEHRDIGDTTTLADANVMTLIGQGLATSPGAED